MGSPFRRMHPEGGHPNERHQTRRYPRRRAVNVGAPQGQSARGDTLGEILEGGMGGELRVSERAVSLSGFISSISIPRSWVLLFTGFPFTKPPFLGIHLPKDLLLGYLFQELSFWVLGRVF